jgi:hypothetical protein
MLRRNPGEVVILGVSSWRELHQYKIARGLFNVLLIWRAVLVKPNVGVTGIEYK